MNQRHQAWTSHAAEHSSSAMSGIIERASTTIAKSPAGERLASLYAKFATKAVERQGALLQHVVQARNTVQRRATQEHPSGSLVES